MHTTGPERLGMINEVSSAVSGAHMEILSSRATLLGGDFSMMVHLRSNDAAAIDALHSELAKVPGIDWWVHDASATNDSSHTVGPGRAARILRLSGDNCPGIIAAVSKYLHKRGVVVMNLASEMGMFLPPPPHSTSFHPPHFLRPPNKKTHTHTRTAQRGACSEVRRRSSCVSCLMCRDTLRGRRL